MPLLVQQANLDRSLKLPEPLNIVPLPEVWPEKTEMPAEKAEAFQNSEAALPQEDDKKAADDEKEEQALVSLQSTRCVTFQSFSSQL